MHVFIGPSRLYLTEMAVDVSPDELNSHLQTVVVVPLTTGRVYPFRIATKVQGKPGVAAIDEVRTVDKGRLVKRLSTLSAKTAGRLSDALVEMFAV